MTRSHEAWDAREACIYREMILTESFAQDEAKRAMVGSSSITLAMLALESVEIVSGVMDNKSIPRVSVIRVPWLGVRCLRKEEEFTQ